MGSVDSDLESDSHCQISDKQLQPETGTRSPSSRGRRSVSLPVFPSQLKPTTESYPTWDGRVSSLENIRKVVAKLTRMRKKRDAASGKTSNQTEVVMKWNKLIQKAKGWLMYL